jgi:TatD DNase family protein
VLTVIDTHCHLAHRRLNQHADEVLQRARDAGVRAVVCAAGDLDEAEAAMELTSRYDDVYFTVGVHPHEAQHAGKDYLRQIGLLADNNRNVAIGEIGLDYHYDLSPREVQRRVFAEQLALAAELAKPVVIHTREAFDDTLAILAESHVEGQRVVFHSFTAGEQQARQALETGGTIGFSGIVTFRKADELRRAAALVPDDRILVETDAPYLSPEPVRKMKTNEPGNVVHVVRRLAAIRGTTDEKIAEITSANAMRLFHPVIS